MTMPMLTVRASSRCPFPSCVLGAEHDGDHNLKRPPHPRGVLRFVWAFRHAASWNIQCEGGDCSRKLFANALYVDEFGFGWSLCWECEKRFGAPILAEVVPFPKRRRRA